MRTNSPLNAVKYLLECPLVFGLPHWVTRFGEACQKSNIINLISVINLICQ